MTSLLKKITFSTIAVHLLFIGYLCIEPTPTQNKIIKKKVAVTTVSLKQKVPEKPKEVAPQKEAPKKIVPQKEAPKKSNLVKNAKKALAKMEKIEAHSSEIVESAPQPSEDEYTEGLIKRLKLQMHLPEFGQVQVSVTIERSGKVASLEITESASRWNKKYVEKTLPTLLFPEFGKWYPKEDKHTFTLTLSNELD